MLFAGMRLTQVFDESILHPHDEIVFQGMFFLLTTVITSGASDLTAS
jgi:hypothetical protein